MKIDIACLELTNLCNLNCTSCYNRSGLNRDRQEIPLPRFQEAVRRLQALGCMHLLLAGGEPTLHSQFDELLLWLRDFFPGSVGISTNGLLHSQAMIELTLADSRFHVQVSLDGSCEEVNARTRGPGGFEVAKSLLQKISGCPRPVYVKMVISHRNIEDVEAFYRFALAEGGLPEFNFLSKIGNAVEDWEETALTAKEKASVIHTILRLNQELGVNALLPLCNSECPFIVGTDALSVLIRPDGAIFPCQLMVDERYILGNLFALTPEVFDAAAQALFSLARKRLDTDYGCQRCMMRAGCKRGCMAKAIQETDDPLGNDGQCELMKRQWANHKFLRYMAETNRIEFEPYSPERNG